MEWSSTFTVTTIEDTTQVLPRGPERSGETAQGHRKLQKRAGSSQNDMAGGRWNRLGYAGGYAGRYPDLHHQPRPALTLDWECHRATWLKGWPGSEPSVKERTLSSGVTVIVFSILQSVNLPDQGLDMTTARHHGYDALTGRMVLVEANTTGTLNWEPFSVVMVQELVAEDTVSVEHGDRDQTPKWLTDLINQLENEPVANPPSPIIRYRYKSRTVYFVPQRCCGIFSDLYDADGNIIGRAEGGITGRGDSRVPTLRAVATSEPIGPT